MATKIFNKIPESVRNLEKKLFKKTLKNYLLKNTFYKLEDYLENKLPISTQTDMYLTSIV